MSLFKRFEVECLGEDDGSGYEVEKMDTRAPKPDHPRAE